MNEEFFEKLKEMVTPYLGGGGGHGIEHVFGVYNLAIKIGDGENVDLDVVRAAALLHDIARAREEDEDICHAKEGAKMAGNILEEMGFPSEKIEKVAHAIEVHRYSRRLKAETREAEILQDADRLEALGSTIVIRMLQNAGKYNRVIYDPKIPPKEEYDGSKSSVINHIHEKILKITPESFKTPKAREIARGRYDFVKKFVAQFMKEWEETHGK